MAFEFGVFHEFSRSTGQTEAEAFAKAFAQVDDAERWGVDVIWLAELHFLPERSVLSAPLLIAAAIASRTKRIKLGIAVQVLPLCHPLRLAEEVATLDHVSQGRLVFGVGRSGFARTYEAYGIPYGESKERFAEVLEVLKRSWADGHFSFDGQFYKYHNVAMVPKPLQKPHPALRIAASSADTFPTIGAMGLPVFVAVRLGTLEELGPDIKAYREAYRAADHPGNGQVYLRVPIYVGEDEKSARAPANGGPSADRRWAPLPTKKRCAGVNWSRGSRGCPLVASCQAMYARISPPRSATSSPSVSLLLMWMSSTTI